jgi:hypothetical protein
LTVTTTTATSEQEHIKQACFCDSECSGAGERCVVVIHSANRDCCDSCATCPCAVEDCVVGNGYKLIDFDASASYYREEFVGAKYSSAYCPPEFVRKVDDDDVLSSPMLPAAEN